MIAAAEGLPVSIQVRLVRHAKAVGMDPNLVLARFAIERFLYRLSRSRHADRFILKGALLMLVWLGETIRPTRDADLLGLGEMSEQSLVQICRRIRDDGEQKSCPKTRKGDVRRILSESSLKAFALSAGILPAPPRSGNPKVSVPTWDSCTTQLL